MPDINWMTYVNQHIDKSKTYSSRVYEDCGMLNPHTGKLVCLDVYIGRDVVLPYLVYLSYIVFYFLLPVSTTSRLTTQTR